jgi:hypothetical protein
VGSKVQGLSRHPEVTGAYPPTHPEPATPGQWLCEQRQLRGLSRCFVAARTRIPAERIEAIELGRVELADDAVGRGTARQLACAIGAEPDQALARLGTAGRTAPTRIGELRLPRPIFVGGGLVALALIGALLYAGTIWVERAGSAERAGVVYRPDYVDDLLEHRGP